LKKDKLKKDVIFLLMEFNIISISLNYDVISQLNGNIIFSQGIVQTRF
jgi:hypothetical protein